MYLHCEAAAAAISFGANKIGHSAKYWSSELFNPRQTSGVVLDAVFCFVPIELPCLNWENGRCRFF